VKEGVMIDSLFEALRDTRWAAESTTLAREVATQANAEASEMIRRMDAQVERAVEKVVYRQYYRVWTKSNSNLECLSVLLKVG
jgi:hypothetical protein